MPRTKTNPQRPAEDRLTRAVDFLSTTLIRLCGLLLPLFVLAEVNYPHLTPHSQLALFALFGLALAFLAGPRDRHRRQTGGPRKLDLVLALLAIASCAYVVSQSEPLLARLWLDGQSLGSRAGIESAVDVLIGLVGLVLVLEAARRTVGWALPILAVSFIAYAALGPWLPAWFFPHRGYGIERIVGQTFLHSQGVFGLALKVMFSYVFLFILFGAVLEATGATRFIIEGARRLFGRSPGGPAKVAVLSSGLMGSLSGSAVANTASTGTFTIPMMRSAGFPPHVAAGLEAAASSGGALVPPVMGAGAYMMLEIIDPPVTYVEVIRAALLPACLYYLSIFLIVHFGSRMLAAVDAEPVGDRGPSLVRFEGLIFLAGLGGLIGFLLAGLSIFRSVTLALVGVLLVSSLHSRTRLTIRSLLAALAKASQGGVALISAAACVGIVIGVVTLTGIGSRLPAAILPLAQEHLLLALVAIMVSSIILGMGLPSAVCYLLMATLIGPVLGRLGVEILAAHLFVFYFGLMSMVTPPVALAAYTASSIAGSGFLRTSAAAFRFALAGFALPFLFVLRPELLLLDGSGGQAAPAAVATALALAVAGTVALSAAIAGHLARPLNRVERALLLAVAFMILFPGAGPTLLGVSAINGVGVALLALTVLYQRRGHQGRR